MRRAIALALLSPERFAIEGFVGAHFANSFSNGPDSVEQSVREIELLLDKAGMAEAQILVVDVGGNNIKIKHAAHVEKRKVKSGPEMTPEEDARWPEF